MHLLSIHSRISKLCNKHMIMEFKNDTNKPISLLQGDGFCINKILARESLVGQSSRIFYRAAEGVPFKWEMQPGTPKNPQEEEIVLPLSPSPLMQSLGLPLPNVDHDDVDDDHNVTSFKTLKIWSLRRMVKKVESIGIRRSKQQESSSFGDFKDSSFSSDSDLFSSFSSNGRFVDTSAGLDGPFCCSPWNIPAILDEGNTKIYYCIQHRTAFSIEKDGSFLSRILSRESSSDQFSGPLQATATIPFTWEEQPGTPKTPPEDELVLPPSPPPAAQSLALPRSRQHVPREKSRTRWARFWTRLSNKKNDDGKAQREVSFRHRDDERLDASFRESVSSVAPLSKGGRRVLTIKRSLKGCHNLGSCGPWSGREILVFVRRKLKSFTS